MYNPKGIRMKKIIVSLALVLVSLSASAQHRYGHHHYHPVYSPGIGWVIPMIVGGVITYEVVRSQQPVVVQQPPVVVQPNVVCSEWKEIQTPEGKIYRERNCSQQ